MGRAGGAGGGRGGSFGGSRGGSFGGGSSSRGGASYGRSSSGFGSSNRSYTSTSRPRTTVSTGGYWGVPRMGGPVIINNSGNNNNRNYKNYDNNGGMPNNNSNNNQKSSYMGCLHTILIVIMILSIMALLFNTFVLAGSNNEQRTPLSKGAVIETEYYTDELGWINNKSELLKGMKHFYNVTGVQPYLYITDYVGGNFFDNAEEFANNKYEELFSDEAHVLVIFCEKDDYYTYCISGIAADNVIDSDARNILLNKIDEYYYDSSLDDDEYFSKAFKEAADEIMAEPPSGFVSIVVPIIIFALALSTEFIIIKKAKEAKRDKELKEMFDKPLETFGNTEAEELARKYETSENKSESITDVPAQENIVEELPSIPKPVQQDNIICSNCGKREDADNNFCSGCGTKLK